jgi:hypothetical protein
MRKSILAGAIGVLALTGCATGPSDYERYAQAQENIALAKAEAEAAKYKALETIALKGDAGASAVAAMGIAMGGSIGVGPREPQIIQPRSTADKLLPWASLLVPSLTQFYSIQQNTAVQLRHSDNSLAGKKSDNGMIVDLVQGRIPPVIGTEDDVLLYPR